MSKPIINPWIVYFAQISSVLRIVLPVLGGAILGITLMVMLLSTDPLFEEDFKFIRKYYLRLIAFSIVGIMLFVFLPSKETIYTMTLLNNITTENIEIFKGGTRELVDYVVDRIGEIK